MMKYVTGIGATGLMLLAVVSLPGVVAAHGTVSGEDDPCLRQVAAFSSDQRFGNEIAAHVASELTSESVAVANRIAMPPPREWPNSPNFPVISFLRFA